KDRGVAAEFTQQQRYLICHRKWSEARLQAELPKAVDVLELFAFVRPAQFCLPTPAGLAARLGLAIPVSAEDKALTIFHAAQKLIDELADQPDKVKQKLARLADMMGRGGWQWTGPVMAGLGAVSGPEGPPDGRNAAIWVDLDEIDETPPRGEPGISPILPDASRKRLRDMLGQTAETRKSQSDYAAALASVFASPDSTSGPVLLLAEAGTGTGKTLGYLAPATLWAEANKAAVWVSTYTRTLQHQIADELSRLHDRSETGGKKVVIRKGRENYLCLLNLEEALLRLPGQPADAVALGLMARWASASPDGDLTGSSFPAWLIDLIGTRTSLGLADRRGECIHSACLHYHKCFVEKSIRTARQADIVIANHALVMVQATLGGMEDKFSPTRYIFDEGHNVFDAADSAFAAALTAGETAELRRWVRGAEDGRRGRARGLEKRLAELISGDESALAALDEASEAARILPGTGWRKRLNEASPAGPAEVFFATVREAVYSRVSSPDSLYDLQAELYPAPEAVIKAGLEFKNSLDRL
ncbi:MAG: ATP-dependent DNA helicase, partial [Candidatus Puniceispirillaceae bacterium]